MKGATTSRPWGRSRPSASSTTKRYGIYVALSVFMTMGSVIDVVAILKGASPDDQSRFWKEATALLLRFWAGVLIVGIAPFAAYLVASVFTVA